MSRLNISPLTNTYPPSTDISRLVSKNQHQYSNTSPCHLSKHLDQSLGACGIGANSPPFTFPVGRPATPDRAGGRFSAADRMDTDRSVFDFVLYRLFNNETRTRSRPRDCSRIEPLGEFLSTPTLEARLLDGCNRLARSRQDLYPATGFSSIMNM